MKTIILHAHLFKNAGSTIDWILNNNFKTKFIDHRDNQLMKSGNHYLANFLSTKDVMALSSHHLPLPLPDIKDINIILIMMLRHPLERVSSVYNFERKQLDVNTPGSIKARKLSFNEYIKWRLSDEGGYVISNYHLRTCLGANKKVLDEDDLHKAKIFITNTECIGVVEEFDKSLLVMQHEIRKSFDGFNAQYKRINTNQHQNNTIKQRLTDIRNSLDDDSYNLLIKLNSLDIELYNYTKDIVLKRFDKLALEENSLQLPNSIGLLKTLNNFIKNI